MATYKVWLKVKDGYGNIKELDGGTFDVDLTKLTEAEAEQIKEVLPLKDYIKRANLDTELDAWATDLELDEVKQDKTLKYSELNFKAE